MFLAKQAYLESGIQPIQDSPFRMLRESNMTRELPDSALTFAERLGVDKETMVSNCCHEARKQAALLRQELEFKGE